MNHTVCNSFPSLPTVSPCLPPDAHPHQLGKFVLPQDAILGSTKVQQLEKMLPDLKARGSRVLLFSQWTSVLDLLEWYLALRGHAYCRLDGSTNVRHHYYYTHLFIYFS